MKKKITSILTAISLLLGAGATRPLIQAEEKVEMNFKSNFNTLNLEGKETFRLDAENNLLMDIQNDPEKGEDLEVAPFGAVGETLKFKMTFSVDTNLAGGAFYDTHPLLDMGGFFRILKIGGNYIRVKTSETENSQLAVNAGEYYTVMAEVDTVNAKIKYSIYENSDKASADAIKDVTHKEHSLFYCVEADSKLATSPYGGVNNPLKAVKLGTKPNAASDNATSILKISELYLKDETLFDYIDLSSLITGSNGTDGIGDVGDTVGVSWLGGKTENNQFGGIKSSDLPADGIVSQIEYDKRVKTGNETPFTLYTEGYSGGEKDSFNVATAQNITIGKCAKYVNILTGTSGWDNFNIAVNYKTGNDITFQIPIERPQSVSYHIEANTGETRYNNDTYGFTGFADTKWLQDNDGVLEELNPNGASGFLSLKVPTDISREIESISLQSGNALVYAVTLEKPTKAEIYAAENNFFKYDNTNFNTMNLEGLDTFSINEAGNLVMNMQPNGNDGEKLNVGGNGVKGKISFKMIYHPETALTSAYYDSNSFANVGDMYKIYVLGDFVSGRIFGTEKKDARMFSPDYWYTFISNIDTETSKITYSVFECGSLNAAKAVTGVEDTTNRIVNETISGLNSDVALGDVILSTKPSTIGTGTTDIIVYHLELAKNVIPELKFDTTLTVNTNSATADLTMKNTTDSDQDYCIIVAAYGENNRLLKVDVSQAYKLNKNNENETNSFTMEDIPTGALKYKAMIWENLDNLRPLEMVER